MTANRLEERIATLERQVAELMAAVKQPPRKDWRRTIGMFTGDEIMKEVFEEALKYREADRRRARRQFAKKRRAKT